MRALAGYGGRLLSCCCFALARGAKLQGIITDPLEASLGSTAQELSNQAITNVKQQSGTDNVIVTVPTAAGIVAAGQTVLIVGLGQGSSAVSPVSANGRWLVASVSGSDVTLTGASWAGPTFANSSWTAGAPAISVYDTTNDSTS